LSKVQHYLKILLWSIPLPYIAGQLGWIVAEVGRQPWIVYGLLRTSDAVSKAVEPTQVMLSLIGFTLFYSILGLLLFISTKGGVKMEFQIIWFILWGLLWAVYFALDGFDLGAGILYPFISKK